MKDLSENGGRSEAYFPLGWPLVPCVHNILDSKSLVYSLFILFAAKYNTTEGMNETIDEYRVTAMENHDRARCRCCWAES